MQNAPAFYLLIYIPPSIYDINWFLTLPKTIFHSSQFHLAEKGAWCIYSRLINC